MVSPFVVFQLFGPVALVVGVVLWFRTSTSGHVPVQAVVVQYANWTRPGHVVFDYPLPDGTWGRARRTTGIVSPVIGGRRGALVAAGDRFTVYVDPRRPADVKLARRSSAGASAGVMLVIFGLLSWRMLG